MAEIWETNINHCAGEDWITVCTAEKKWVNRLRKLSKQHEDDVTIVAENPDGSLLVRLPYSWFQFPRPKRHVTPMSEERRAEVTENLRRWHEEQRRQKEALLSSGQIQAKNDLHG